MAKIVEFENVYLEYPDVYEIEEEESQDLTVTESRTAKLSLEELQRRLEETQSLHL